MHLLKKSIELVNWLNTWIGKLLYPLMLLICIVIFIEIVMRTVFNNPTTWTFETTQFLFIICTFLAAGHLLRDRGHIGVDIIYSKFSRKRQVLIDILTFPFFVLFVGSLLFFGFEFAFDSLMKFERTGSVWDPVVFPIKFAVPIGATLLMLQGICNLIEDILSLQHKENNSPKSEARNVSSI
ncbi:TRAP transporter small permease subunit [candidate division KSB1 bacterium]|nr:TRAP transporter small permease subunit [candidate division KSB1 bacterium]